MSMIKNVWQSLSGESKPGKDLVLETFSQTSATVGQLGGCSGLHMWGGVENCMEEPQSFPKLIQCSKLVSEQGVQSAMFLSSLLIKFPPGPRTNLKEKQRNMHSIVSIIDYDPIAFWNCKENKTRPTKRLHLNLFNIRTIKHKQNVIKT
jgi:hypothetical protein